MPLIINPQSYYSYQNELFSTQASNAEIIEKSSNNILITSIHGLPHIREDKIKAADSGSLEFAYLLAKFSNSSFYGLNTPDILDNNYYSETPQKALLSKFIKENNIKFILDIHTCHAVRPYDVEIGSMDNTSLFEHIELQEVLETIVGKHFFCINNQVFKGIGSDNSETMIRFFANKLGIACLQIEINSALINEDDSLYVLHQKTKLLHCFCEFIKKVNL